MASLSNLKATLVLRTDDLTNNSTSDIGTCDQFNTNFTWRNVNMKLLLGNMAQDYDNFGISLSCLNVGIQAAAFGTATIDRTVDLNFSGLTFKNSCYSVISKTNKQSVNLESVILNTGSFISSINLDSFGFVFTNDTEIVDLNIKLTRSFQSGSTYDIATTTVFPQMVFTFKIVGIPRQLKVLNV